MGFRTAVTASLLLASQVTADLDPIVQKGSKLFTKSGEQFFMKGIAYQQESAGPGGKTSKNNDYKDPLADGEACTRDAKIMKSMNINTIRTYAVNPDKNHDACMKTFADAGIYVISDLSQPGLSINRDSPAWNVELFERYTAVVDDLGKYTNTIGFFAGNEVTNNATNTGASAYVKAAVRDVKKHIADKGDRWMGVGYAANDDSEIRDTMAQYFNCGDEKESIDFWGYNIYSWCGKSTYEESGYDVQTKFFSNFSVPVFFAEVGCNSPGGADNRQWDDVAALLSDPMDKVFSGGIGYMYFEEENDYGVVRLSGDKATQMKNGKTLGDKYGKAKPNGVKMDSYNSDNKAATCPNVGKNWQAADGLPPTPDSALCECAEKSATCVPADDLQEKEFGEIFGYICGNDKEACAGIKADTEKGVYGPYLGCNPKQQLAVVLDAYYKKQKTDDACDFKGSAKKQQGSDDGKCQAAISSASAAAEVAATATAGSTTSDGSSSSSSGSAASGRPTGPLMTTGGLAMGLYMVVAMGLGAGMVML